MSMHLVVVKSFAGFTRGDIVIDEALVADILRGEQSAYVVRVVTPVQRGD